MKTIKAEKLENRLQENVTKELAFVRLDVHVVVVVVLLICLPAKTRAQEQVYQKLRTSR